MWEWLMTNGIWLLVAASVLLLLLLGRQWLHEVYVKLAPKQPLEVTGKKVRRIILIIGGTLLMIIAVAFAAVVASREGVPAAITPETVQKWFLEHGIFIIILLLVGVGLWQAIGNFLPPLVQRVMARPVKGQSKQEIKKRTDTLTAVFVGLGKIVLATIIVFMILSELNVPIGPIMAGFGVVGIAVGFGAQYLIRDLIAGIFILLENQYRVGDVAKVADVAGLVEEVNLRKTVLRDLDGIVHHVPNGEIRVASNYTRQYSRVNLNVRVAYKTNLDHVINVINRVGEELAKDEKWRQKIITTPQVLRVDNLGDSGIELKILGDVKPIEQWDIMGELRKRIKEAFDKEGIEIPWVYTGLSPGQSQTAHLLPCQACSHPNLPGSKFCSNCGANLQS
jgi:small conductance mechanosensitive channel